VASCIPGRAGGVLRPKRAGISLLLGRALALPLLLLGGRGGEDASSATLERIRLLAEADQHVALSSALGGLGQFNEYPLHDRAQFLLVALAELGLPGMFCRPMLYLSAKIPVVRCRHAEGQRAEFWLARSSRALGRCALLAAFIAWPSASSS